MDRCYNCGVELTDLNRTREHIPAQNTFVGYPTEYKENRLTVPACFDCNNQYSKIDQEIRDAIGIMNDNNEMQAELTRKAITSIMRNHKWSERVEWKDGMVASVSFSYDSFKELHIKNFKGLFYKTYEFPLPQNYMVEILADGDFDDFRLSNIATFLTAYLYDGGNLKISGHKDIFEYKLKTLTPMENGLINNSPTLENALGVAGILVYHKKIKAVVVAAEKSYLESIRKNMQL